MKATDGVKKVMEESGLKNVTLAGRLGVRTGKVIDRLSQSNISVAKLAEMLKVMDYKVVIVPAGKRLSEGEYEIE